jgi:tripartite-type tricarboxylate transporter receptor subunit TctC
MVFKNLVQILACAAAMTAAALSADASESAFPTKPIRIVVPYAAGGTIDPLARLVADKLAKYVNQPVTVENQPGAGGNIGTANVVRGPNDGYSLVAGSAATAVNATLYKKIPFQIETDLIPVGLIARFPMVLIASETLNVKTMPELIARAKKTPADVDTAITGNGNLDHMVVEQLKAVAKLDIHIVNHQGVPNSLTAIMRGDMKLFALGVNSALPYIQAKKVVPLAVTSATRASIYPEVPTMIESGFPGFEMYGWAMLFAPGKTPRHIVEKLHADIAKAVGDQDVISVVEKNGGETKQMSLAELKNYVTAETKKYGDIVRAIGLEIN